MATRKIFIDLDEKNLITPFIDEGLFTLHLRTTEDDLKVIKFSKEDAKEFIKELWKIGKKL